MCYYLPSQNMYLCDKTFDIHTVDEMEEMDTLEKIWKEAAKKKSIYELLEIFPEARAAHIKYLKQSIQDNKKFIDILYRKERELTNLLYEKSAPENRWYWEACINHLFTKQRIKLEQLLKKESFFLASFSHPVSAESTNHITDEEIARAKEVPIESLYPGGLVGHNGKKFGTCPLHEDKTPSFAIYTVTNSFYCFSCSFAGDSISFIMKTRNLDFIEAVKFLLHT